MFLHHPQRKNGTVLQNCPNCGAVNSANARSCYVCVSALASAAAEPSSKRRYSSFPDEVPLEASAASDAGAALARDLMKGFQRAAKPAKKIASRKETAAPAPAAVLDTLAVDESSPPIVPLASTPVSAVDTFASPVDIATALAIEAASAPLVSTAAKILAAREAADDNRVRAETPAAASASVAELEAPAPAVESVWAAELAANSEPAAKAPDYEGALAAAEETLLAATNLAKAVAASEAQNAMEATKAQAAEETLAARAADEAEPVGVIACETSEPVASIAETASLAPVWPSPAPMPAAIPTAEPARRETSATTFGSLQPTVMASNDWRRELTNRVEAYRARTGQGGEEEPLANVALEGEPETLEAQEESEATCETAEDSLFETAPQPAAEEAPVEEVSPRASLRTASRNRAAAVEILSLQPEFDFAAAETDEHPHAPLVPVAEMGERRIAGLLDATFIVSSYLAFLVFFSSLGGKITFGKTELAIYGVTFFLFYAQYFVLFTVFGCPTPGMMMRGLRAVNFDGTPPDSRQLMLRSMGYLASAGALLLGFLWSLWDEDHLTWHDRMSHTYLTHAAPQTHVE